MPISGVTGLSDAAAILRTARTWLRPGRNPESSTHDASAVTAPKGARQISMHARREEERRLLHRAGIRH
ncbi:hypothetical protein KRM28CT15_50730 [Krasilnikovia sp. M28-CT-15]